MSSDEAVRETVVIDRADLENVRALAVQYDVEATEIPPFRGIDPATVAVLLIGVPAAVAAIGQEIERRKGGQVFDLRPGAARPIYRTKDLGYGFLTVFAADGTVRIAQYQPKTIVGELISALNQLASRSGEKTVEAVVAAIESVPGNPGITIEIDGPNHEPTS